MTKPLRVVEGGGRESIRLTFETAPPFLTFRQAAELLHVGKNAITEAVRSGHVPAVNVTPSMRRIPLAALRRLAHLDEAGPPD